MISEPNGTALSLISERAALTRMNDARMHFDSNNGSERRAHIHFLCDNVSDQNVAPMGTSCV
jgi:hypothetical protein